MATDRGSSWTEPRRRMSPVLGGRRRRGRGRMRYCESTVRVCGAVGPRQRGVFLRFAEGELMSGIWHTGVLAFGREYWFGGKAR